MAKKPIKITEVVLRDAHQSLLATRMTMDEMRPILPEMDKIPYFSVECWGGATFDSCIRFLDEDPWERAFYEMANAGSGNIDITLLSGGIYEAMITTVGGLIVGIIAMFAYNYLVMLVDRVVNKMESRTMEFMDLLNEPAQK